MRCSLILAVGFLCLAAPARSDDSLPETVISAVKRATVYVQVQGSNWKGSGSGFVVKADKDTVLIATNYHVLTGPSSERKLRSVPSEVMRSLKAVTATVVFDSGTRSERSAKAEPIAADADNDLAILRVMNLKDPPSAIDYANPPKLTETMPVYTFGYPFGQALSTGKGSPAVTVGKASISSIRLDENGELSLVQIDGSLNPGNSGGPLVDTKGRLVGVAVATIKDSRGIGLAVPALELGRMMRGRLGGVHTTVTKGADGTTTIKAEVGLIDPVSAIRGVTLHYLTVGPKGTKPARADALEKLPGVRKVSLKIDGRIASGELTLEKAEGELFVQAVPDGESRTAVASVVRSIALVGGGGVAAHQEPAAKPPVGWKEYTPRDHAFTVWVPEKPTRQSERERTSIVRAQRLKVTSLQIEMPGGLKYLVEKVTMPLTLTTKLKRPELEEAFRDVIVSEVRGTLKEQTTARMGAIPGREYLIETGRGLAQVRIFVAGGGRVYILQVEGSKEQVEREATKTFLNSCRLATGPIRPEIAGPGVDNPKPNVEAKPKNEAKPIGEADLAQLLTEMKSSDPNVRKSAAERLAKVKPAANREEVAKALEALMADPNIFVRGAVAKALGIWGGKENVPGVVALVTHQDIFIRGAAMDVLGVLKDERAAEPIAKRLSDGFDRGKASETLRKMGAIAESAVAKRLSSDLKDVRIECCKILSVIGTNASVPALEETAKDTDRDVSIAAKDALTRIKP